MASLRYRAGGWDLRYRERSGKERTERFTGGSPRRAPRPALERKAEVETRLHRGTYVPREEREAPFETYYQRWLASRQVSETRVFTDAQRAAKHVLPYWSKWEIGQIRPSDIDDWVADLSRKMGPHSVRHCYALLRGPLRRAAKDRVIDNPCIDIVLPKLPDMRKTFDDVLTAEEVDRLVAGFVDEEVRYARLRTNDRYRALVFMGAWLGPRWNEAIGLRVCDLNPLRKEVTFGRIVVNQNGSRTQMNSELSKKVDAGHTWSGGTRLASHVCLPRTAVHSAKNPSNALVPFPRGVAVVASGLRQPGGADHFAPRRGPGMSTADEQVHHVSGCYPSSVTSAIRSRFGCAAECRQSRRPRPPSCWRPTPLTGRCHGQWSVRSPKRCNAGNGSSPTKGSRSTSTASSSTASTGWRRSSKPTCRST